MEIGHPTNKFVNFLLNTMRHIGGMGILTARIVTSFAKPPYYPRLMLEQINVVGVNSIVLLFVTGLATGSVMALQFGFGLEKFGGKLYVPKIVALSIMREMGPVFSGLMVAARVGAGMAAEIGSMKVTQQIDAIRALGTSPIKRIVVPRMVAVLVALPLLTIFVDFVAIGSAMLVSITMGIGPYFFIEKAVGTIQTSDVVTGFIKSLVFAYLIVITACYRGLNTGGGTRGVGDTTTLVVVTASISVMISDFFLSSFFIQLGY
jgi:phospholipid/cholesterol/gamma-HCH transport system permease protein